MKENIATIPINDLFAPKDGCPICSMWARAERGAVDFIMSDAMMVPEIRIETNRKGFCNRHYNMMYKTGQRLPNALILESHLQEIIDEVLPKKPASKPDKKALEKLESLGKSCYVCDRIEATVIHLLATVYAEYMKSESFRELYRAQPYICLNHYTMLMRGAMGKRGVSGKFMADFHRDTYELTKNYLQSLKVDVSHYCAQFDYRNRGSNFGETKDVIPRTVEYLTGEGIS